MTDSNRRWVTRLVVASLACSVLSGNSDRLGLVLPLDRILLAGALALLLLTGGARELGRLRWRPVHTAMVGTVLWASWSALTHGALQTAYGSYALLDRIVVPFLLFALAPVLFAREEDRRLLLRTLVVLGLYLGATAVLEIAGPSWLVLPRYVMDPEAGILFGRARGPFVQPEANGLVLAACMFASALYVSRARGAWRVASAAAVLLTATGVVLTLTRSVWVGAALGVLVLMVVVPPLRRRLVALVAGAAAAGGLLLLTVPGLTTVLVDRLTTARSIFDRQNTNAAALRAVGAHPIDGIGWTQFLGQSTDWVRQADDYPITNVDIEVHNVLLSRAAELGLVGAALWVACVLAGPVLAATRRPGDPDLQGWQPVFIGYACVWGVCAMLSPLPYVLPNNLFWLLAGMVLRDHLLPHAPAVDRHGPGAGPAERDAPAHDDAGPRASTSTPGAGPVPAPGT
ncbi:O-antigen ligase family protein [Geodermatophilus sp. SYSU D00742]